MLTRHGSGLRGRYGDYYIWEYGIAAVCPAMLIGLDLRCCYSFMSWCG